MLMVDDDNDASYPSSNERAQTGMYYQYRLQVFDPPATLIVEPEQSQDQWQFIITLEKRPL
jgi:hypothetical protein